MFSNNGHAIQDAPTPLEVHRNVIIMGKRYYGKQLLLDAEECNGNILSIQMVTDFIKQLVKEIDMLAWDDPLVEHFPQDDSIGSVKGISAVQLIYTSSITLHGHDNTRDMYLDVFSCKDFCKEEVEKFVTKFFKPKSITSQVVLRR